MKIALLGLGSIGLRHACNLLRMGHKVIAYDPEPSPDSLKLFESEGGDFTKNRDNLFNYSLFKACVVASPSICHWNDVKDAIGTGLNVFVEKPLGLCSTESFSFLLDRAERKKLIVFVGCMLRFHPCVKTLKENFYKLGNPLWGSFCVAQKSIKEPYLKDGVIYNWGSHEIDLALYLLGPAKVTCSSHTMGIADICLTHENKVRSTIHLDYFTQPEHRVTVIAGDQGLAVMDLANRTLVMKTETDPMSYEFNDTFDSNYVEEMQDFILRVEGNDKRMYGATGNDGLEVLRICHAADGYNSEGFKK